MKSSKNILRNRRKEAARVARPNSSIPFEQTTWMEKPRGIHWLTDLYYKSLSHPCPQLSIWRIGRRFDLWGDRDHTDVRGRRTITCGLCFISAFHRMLMLILFLSSSDWTSPLGPLSSGFETMPMLNVSTNRIISEIFEGYFLTEERGKLRRRWNQAMMQASLMCART